MSNFTRKMKRRAMRAALKKQLKRHRGPCFVKKCSRNGNRKYHCRLCEEKGKSFEIQYCDYHENEAEQAIKRHVLRRHPGVLPAWIWHKLAGGE